MRPHVDGERRDGAAEADALRCGRRGGGGAAAFGGAVHGGLCVQRGRNEAKEGGVPLMGDRHVAWR